MSRNDSFDPLDLKNWYHGRVALVTGASSGMGYEMALALGRAGARVGVNYRSNRKSADELCTRIREAGGQAVSLQADVSQPGDVDRIFGELVSSFGGDLEMLVNNAGDWMDKSPIAECPLDKWEYMFNVNVRSVFLCCQHAAKLMMKHQRGGSIINMGSIAGHTGGGGGTVPYASAKAAVHTFTRGLAKELAPYDVRVNAIAPGMVDTPMLKGRVSPEGEKALLAATPLKRMARADEFGATALYLLSPASAFVTGEIIEVNGGLLMR